LEIVLSIEDWQDPATYVLIRYGERGLGDVIEREDLPVAGGTGRFWFAPDVEDEAAVVQYRLVVDDVSEFWWEGCEACRSWLGVGADGGV